MDAKVFLKADLPARHATGGRVRSGRTLAEMAVHIFSGNRAGDILRLDVAGGRVERTLPRVEPAERAKDWKLCGTGRRSGATGKYAHAPGAGFLDGMVTRPGAEEAQCYADM
jgi:hypothetical protein